MRKETLPAGEDARRTWRTINRYVPKDADAFAASVWRYAETGEEPPPDVVAPGDWAAAKAEVERITAAREAGRKGGEAGAGVSRNAGNRNASKTIAKSIAKSIPTRTREYEDEDKDKNDNPKTEDEDARVARAVSSVLSSFGISSPSPSSDFGTWARMQGDPVEVALKASREGAASRRVYGRALQNCREAWGREEGARRFVDVCIDFNAECEAGEEPRNRGAALVARLRALAGGPAPKVEAAPAPVEGASAKESPSTADGTTTTPVVGNAPTVEADEQNTEEWRAFYEMRKAGNE